MTAGTSLRPQTLSSVSGGQETLRHTRRLDRLRIPRDVWSIRRPDDLCSALPLTLAPESAIGIVCGRSAPASERQNSSAGRRWSRFSTHSPIRTDASRRVPVHPGRAG